MAQRCNGGACRCLRGPRGCRALIVDDAEPLVADGDLLEGGRDGADVTGAQAIADARAVQVVDEPQIAPRAVVILGKPAGASSDDKYLGVAIVIDVQEDHFAFHRADDAGADYARRNLSLPRMTTPILFRKPSRQWGTNGIDDRDIGDPLLRRRLHDRPWGHLPTILALHGLFRPLRYRSCQWAVGRGCQPV